jgi:2,4-dienoyl-CoA reductase-like NADH-dependent reductase (Old Yellow Enzyme family)
MPTLLDPFVLKDTKLRNRIAVAPMCQYMSIDGLANDWHFVHYSSLARGGAGLVIVEATAISPEGRISWGDAGLWNDAQAAALERVVHEIRKWGAVPGIQLAHAGRKASANRPWEGDNHIEDGQPNSWTTIAPSAIPFGANLNKVPQEMSIADIHRVQADMKRAVERARDVGFEWLQLHFAHGYLAQNFWSHHSNKRTDQYGGNAQNRGRYLLETLDVARSVWPENHPLTARLGVVDFDGNDEQMLSESIDLLKTMKANGLDSVDVSMGFNTPNASVPWGTNMMVDITSRILKETQLPGTTSWLLDEAHGTNQLILDGKIDFASFGRRLLAEPHWPYRAAKEILANSQSLSDEQRASAAWATLPAPYAHWLANYR